MSPQLCAVPLTELGSPKLGPFRVPFSFSLFVCAQDRGISLREARRGGVPLLLFFATGPPSPFIALAAIRHRRFSLSLPCSLRCSGAAMPQRGREGQLSPMCFFSRNLNRRTRVVPASHARRSLPFFLSSRIRPVPFPPSWSCLLNATRDCQPRWSSCFFGDYDQTTHPS